MAQIINTNIASLNAQRNLNNSQSANSTALERLSSGLRINSAKDDAAGLAISTKFESQTRGLNQAIRNAGDGISLAQTAEGALGSMTDNLQRVRELAVQSANATNSDEDRVALQQEVSALVAEITRNADETNFNGRNLFDGNFNGTFQIGANAGQTVDVSIQELTASQLGSSSQAGVSAVGTEFSIQNNDLAINGIDIGASQATDDNASTVAGASSAIAKAEAINRVSDQTGVEAFVETNVAAGSEMTAAQEDGTLTLNGVSISIQTSTDTGSSRASVVEAINSVSEQTGIRAIDTATDSGGVRLEAEDGRNIDIQFGADFSSDAAAAAATGLAAKETYYGGYTLVARGETKDINITGGNGTGNGDISRTGLAEGTYNRATAAAVSESTTASTTAGLGGDAAAGFVNNVAADYGAATDLADDYSYRVSVSGEEIYQAAFPTTTANDMDAMAYIANDINANAGNGVVAFEQFVGTIDSAGGIEAGDTFTLDNGTDSGVVTLTSDDLADLADEINSTDFGATLNVTAAYDGTDIELTVQNFAATAVQAQFDVVNGAVFDLGGTTLVNGQAAGLSGQVAIVNDDGKNTTFTLETADNTTNELIAASGESAFATYTATNGLGDGDLVVNGVAISEAKVSADTASSTKSSDGTTIFSSTKNASGIAIAASINEVSDKTGVIATVESTKVVGGEGSIDTTGFEAGDEAGIFINGTELGAVTLQNDSINLIDTDKAKADAINLINQNSGKTGVTAIDNGTSITLEAADGRNVSVAIDNRSGNTESTSGIGALFGLASSEAGIGEAAFGDTTTASSGTSTEALTYETTFSKVKLESASAFNVDSGSNGKEEVEALGFKVGSFGNGEDGQFLKDVDISTFEGAQAAITAIDNALGTVASQRAELGALQNRFESTVSNLAITAENLTAANSRIRDADFAAETAELSRTQVLQQAGISILAQANQRPQQVLSLLG